MCRRECAHSPHTRKAPWPARLQGRPRLASGQVGASLEVTASCLVGGGGRNLWSVRPWGRPWLVRRMPRLSDGGSGRGRPPDQGSQGVLPVPSRGLGPLLRVPAVRGGRCARFPAVHNRPRRLRRTPHALRSDLHIARRRHCAAASVHTRDQFSGAKRAPAARVPVVPAGSLSMTSPRDGARREVR